MRRQDLWSQMYRKILFRLFIAATIGYFLFGVIACAPSGFQVKQFPHIDKEFIEYVQKFNTIYGVQVYIDIGFNELDGDTVGVCHISSSKRWVEIDHSFWSTLTSIGKEQLLFHELGHCVLDRGHLASYADLPSGTRGPASIMYPYFFGNYDFYYANLEYYYQQLPYAPSLWASSLDLSQKTETESNNNCVQIHKGE